VSRGRPARGARYPGGRSDAGRTLARRCERGAGADPERAPALSPRRAWTRPRPLTLGSERGGRARRAPTRRAPTRRRRRARGQLTRVGSSPPREAIEPERRTAVEGQVGDHLADHRREFEAVTGKSEAVHDGTTARIEV